MLCYVLERVRPDIGVVATEHPDWERTLTPEATAYLRRVYPNFICLDKFEDYEYPSQSLLAHVDAVATVSSTVGLQGLLWKKPVCALGDSHINAIADVTDIEKLGEFLDSKAYKAKDNILYYLLSRFYFLANGEILHNAEWLEKRLQEWLARYRNSGIDENFFGPIDTPFRVLKSYLRGAIPDIPRLSRAKLQRDMIEQTQSHAQIWEIERKLESLRQLVLHEKERQFKRPLDKFLGDHQFDLTNDFHFGPGWSDCDVFEGINYRAMEDWMTDIRFSLQRPYAFTLTLVLAPHKDYPQQIVEALLNGRRLASTILSYGRWSEMEIEVPEDMARVPVTKIVLRSNKVSSAHQKRLLTCRRISFSLGVLPQRRASA
jgi:hypothetical protein